MKIVTVLGARPQFVKAAPLSRALRQAHSEVIVHTGQHYDPQMSDVFFDELAIPAPDHQLRVGSAPHGAQTGRMLVGIEAILTGERPDAVLVYGDTNSTLAGALAASKLAIPVVHVEAGLRSHVRNMPEEINRIVTDRLSTVCCCPNAAAAEHLRAEGITQGVYVVGDVMLDALRDAQTRVGDATSRLAHLHVAPRTYVLLTMHRAANTDDHDRLRAIMHGLSSIADDVLWPMHPRTRHALQRAGIVMPAHVHAVQPLGYLDLVAALSNACAVVTDSGGLQKEAYWLGVPCVTLRAETEWTETVASGWNTLVDADAAQLHAALQRPKPTTPRAAYGDAGAAERVVDVIERTLGKTLISDDIFPDRNDGTRERDAASCM